MLKIEIEMTYFSFNALKFRFVFKISGSATYQLKFVLFMCIVRSFENTASDLVG